MVCWLALFSSRAARAQSVDSQKALAAQALYEQATAHMSARSYAEACPKLEEVTRLVPEGIGARLTLGDCYEKLGKLASAWSQFALAETMAARAGQPERAMKAATRAAALRPRLATLTIEVADPTRSIPGISVVRDGVAVGAAQWGTALPVDAGAHEVLVTAPGYQPWKRDVEAVADGAPVTVKVGTLQAEKAALPAAPPQRGAPGVRPPWDRTWQRPMGLAAIATGTAGLSAGAVLGMLSITKGNQSNQGGHCNDKSYCDPVGLALRDEALALGDASTAAFILGGAVLVGGIVLVATAPPRGDRKPRSPSSPPIAAEMRAAPGGLALTGRW
jgi:hypothetical protein